MSDDIRPQVTAPGEVSQHIRAFRAVAARVEPDAVTPAEAAELWAGFGIIGRLCAATQLRLAARAEQSGEWRDAGCHNPAEHMARQSGSSQRAAHDALRASQRLAGCPGTEAALRADGVSAQQAEVIASAVVVDPSCEGYLLEAAGRVPLFRLVEMARQIRAANDPHPTKTHERIHAERRRRRRTDSEGAWHLSGHGPAEDGALFNHAIGPLVDEMIGQARLEDRHEHHDAYVWDAVHELIRRYLEAADNLPDETAKTAKTLPRRRSRSNRRYLTLIKVDVDKLRGTDDPQGRYVDMPGVGSVPLSIAEDMFPDSILHLVLTRGVDVVNVTTLSRKPTIAQQVKLLWEQPQCSNEACGRSFTQTDHRNPYAQVRCTHVGNLDPLCPHCHRLKTYEGWELVDGKGPRAFVPPSHPRHPANKPKPEAA